MRDDQPNLEISILRVSLFGIFLLFPLVLLGDRLLNASANAYYSFGAFFLAFAAIAALLAVISLNYAFGYLAFLAVLAAELLFNMPLVIFSSHVAMALLFAEGLSSLRPFLLVASNVKLGKQENISSNLRACIGRFRRTFLVVAGSLIALAVAYGLLPDVLPIPSDLSALSLYATLGLVAIALTALYLGEKE